MNEAHQRLCGGPEWAVHLQTEVLPDLVAGVDLGADMLEIGPGAGAATEWLRHRVTRLTALEADQAAAGRLGTRLAGTNVTVVVGDGARTELAAGSFDSIGCFTMLHHVPTGAQQLAVLAEAFRLLRPGGVLVGSDSLASPELHEFHAGDTYNPLDPARLLGQLQALGFHPVTVVVDERISFRAAKPGGNTMPDRLEAAAGAVALADPVAREEPREGDVGGPPCGYCTLTDSDGVWSNAHWRVIPRSWSPIPGGMLLLSNEHIDTLSGMTAPRQREFGPIAAGIEQAIMALGGAARVHLYRWGDGRAHFHAHFIPRPEGRPQFAWRNLPFLERRYPNPGEEALTAAAATVGAALRRAGLPE